MPARKRRRRQRSRSAFPLLAALAVVLVAAVAFAQHWGARPSESPRSHASAPPRTPPPPIAQRAASAAPLTPAPAAVATVAPAPTAASAVPTAGGPRLALIIDDCGQWPDVERGFLALSIPLTLSVLPHVRFGATIAREATAAGKGVMLHVPMETLSGKYPGPGEITTAMDDDAIRAQLRADLADVPLARGVNNHEGSRATADTRVMTDVAEVLAGDGRYFIDSRTTKDSVAEAVARAHGIPTARRNVFLDDVDDLPAVEAALQHAAEIARSDGSAIAIGHPRTATLAAVRALLPSLQASGIEFVLVSELVH